MKKFVALMMVCALMTGMVASAELTYKTGKVETHTIGTDHNGKAVTEKVYYLTVTSDVGDSVQIEVSEDDYKKVQKSEKDAEKTFLAKVGTTLTFWNPND